jgi:hypothetical protein
MSYEGQTFDGETYEHGRDGPRLGVLFNRVWDYMSDGEWHTLGDIAEDVESANRQSVLARLCDFRKQKFGGHIVLRRYVKDGINEYKLIPAKGKAHEQTNGSPAGVGAPVPQDAHRAPCVEHILPGHHTQDGAERAPQATEAARCHPAAQT